VPLRNYSLTHCTLPTLERAKCNSSMPWQINDTSNLFVNFLYNELQCFSNCCIMSCIALKFYEADMLQVVQCHKMLEAICLSQYRTYILSLMKLVCATTAEKKVADFFSIKMQLLLQLLFFLNWLNRSYSRLDNVLWFPKREPLGIVATKISVLSLQENSTNDSKTVWSAY